MNESIYVKQVYDPRKPQLYLHPSGAEQGNPKIIGDIGVNAAYLDPGESCFSIRHGPCALIVLTNGTRSFAVHLMRTRYDPLLIEVFEHIKRDLGGHVKAKLYQKDIDTPEAAENKYLQKYDACLEKVVGAENVEKHGFDDCPDATRNFLVTADGAVEQLTWQRENALRKQFFPGELDLQFPRWEQCGFAGGPLHISEHPRFIATGKSVGISILPSEQIQLEGHLQGRINENALEIE